MFHVIRQQAVAASMADTWSYLTEPQRMGLWFADVDRMAVDESFRFDFGDGDFFSGRVIEMREPDLVDLNWKFMGLGPEFRIRLFVSPLAADAAEVTVVDHGAPTLEEAESLRAGWEDFLSRLARSVKSGESARYRWSETISIGAILDRLPDGLPPELDDDAWWREGFADVRVEIAGNGGSTLSLRLHEPSGRIDPTEARVDSRKHGTATYLEVTHDGWSSLPEAQQIPERRRYAHLWQAALRGLEGKYAR